MRRRAPRFVVPIFALPAAASLVAGAGASAPVARGALPLPRSASGLALQRTRAYVAAGTAGLRILHVSDLAYAMRVARISG